MTTPATAPVSRASTIAADIRGALQPLQHAVEHADAAREASNQANESGINAREQVMIDLAGLSARGQWSVDDISDATDLIKKQSNAGLPKAIATFISEAKNAMHPKVRDDVRDILAVRDAAWDAEAARAKATKDAPTPIKKAFARRYHLLMELLREAKEGNYYPEPSDIVAWAVRRDPDVNPEKAVGVLAKAASTIGEVLKNFPDTDLAAVLQNLNNIVAGGVPGLVKSRVEATGEAPANVVPLPTGGAAPSHGSGPNETATDVAAGAFDLESVLQAA